MIIDRLTGGLFPYQDNKTDGAPSLRPLKLDDFVHAKDKVEE